jgi:hypothetical protein
MYRDSKKAIIFNASLEMNKLYWLPTLGDS